MLEVLARRDHALWLFVSGVLAIAVVTGIATEAGPTAFLAACWMAATLYTRTQDRDDVRLMLSAGAFLLLGIVAGAVPTASACGTPLIESVQHMSEPTPHVHGPCEQANDRRALAADVLLLGGVVTLVVGVRRRRDVHA